MTLLDEGLNAIRTVVSYTIDKGQLGTAVTKSAETDTGLGNPVSSSLLTLDATSITDKTIKFTYKMLSTQGTSATFTEFELLESAVPVDYDRIVFTGIDFAFNGSEDLIISKKYFFRSV